MSNCCSSSDAARANKNTHKCPANGKPYARVKLKTLLHHVYQPWRRQVSEQNYYFCTDPSCNVVYFGDDNTVFNIDDIRTPIWQKTSDSNAAVCYCFGITKAHVHHDDSIKTFIADQTKKSLCACETSNPSGRCCLKDFQKQ